MKKEVAGRSVLWGLQRALLRQQRRALSHWYRTVHDLQHAELVESLQAENNRLKLKLQQREEEISVMQLRLQEQNQIEQHCL